MMGVPIDGAHKVSCDNDIILKNISTCQESPLRKKAKAICYHKAHESIAAGWVKIAKEPDKTYVANLLTKLVKGPLLSHLTTTTS